MFLCHSVIGLKGEAESGVRPRKGGGRLVFSMGALGRAQKPSVMPVTKAVPCTASCSPAISELREAMPGARS